MNHRIGLRRTKQLRTQPQRPATARRLYRANPIGSQCRMTVTQYELGHRQIEAGIAHRGHV